MPRLTVWMVRTSLLQLGSGFTIGMLMLFNKGVPIDPTIWRLLPIHIEMLLLGWTMQLAMGVAFWVLPRFSIAPRYGRERLGWWAYALLNTGLIIFVVGVWSNGAWWLLVGRWFELLAVVCFVVMLWPRVKALSQPSAKLAPEFVSIPKARKRAGSPAFTQRFLKKYPRVRRLRIRKVFNENYRSPRD